MACRAGIRLGPGNLPARASTPGTRGATSGIDGFGPRGLDPHGTELELGDLAERVDLVDRQQVSRRLPEVERDEAVAAGLAVRDAHLQLDGPPPRAHPGQVAV